MSYQPVNLQEKYAKFSQPWSPRVIAEMNDYQLKLARIEGEFVWHSHADTDEVFIVIEGSMVIEFREGEVKLETGELFVVPRGVEHKPRANAECKIMLIEPRGVRNTGDNLQACAAQNDVWI